VQILCAGTLFSDTTCFGYLNQSSLCISEWWWLI